MTLGIFLGAMASASLTPPADAATTSGTLVIGDSLTWRGADKLAALHPDWIIDGVRGRGPSSLVPVLKGHLAATDAPNTLVIALGTNSQPGDTGSAYAAAVGLVPASTRIVFVTPYRDPDVYGVETADRMRQLTLTMTGIANDRPRTELAWWRAVAANHPELLEDGVHQTDPDGENAWAAQVDSAWWRVHPAMAATR